VPAWFHADDYFFARLLVQRGLAAIYFIAFLVALKQFRPLLGDDGLLPVKKFLAEVRFRDSPSLFHVRYSDRLLSVVSVIGMTLALLVVLGIVERLPVAANIAVWLCLWALYLSIVNVGQVFYAFGWETLLLEAGFLVAFLGPANAAVPAPLMLASRWLLFRLELGAGLIKMRGDPCWRDLTCLFYHHETQPMPNPLSWYFHRLPKPLHKCEVLGSHFAQLGAPWLLFFPQPVAGGAALFMAITQSWLVLSGNFSWLNVVTIVLTFAAMSDSMLRVVLEPLHVVKHATTVFAAQDWLVAAVALIIVVLSYKPAKNLFSSAQKMNASFDPLHLVNTYGAFGHVTKVRHEIVLEGTADKHVGPRSTWREYELRGKPGDPKRRPRQFAPYHLRLDWLMWFAGLSPWRQLTWLVPLMTKLLENDEPTLRLLRKNPFPHRPPHAVRALMYRYRFTTWSERKQTGEWWKRTLVGEVVAPIAIDDEANATSSKEVN
jgi:hypothetical protein